MSSRTAKPTRRERAAATRHRILDAAETLFPARGYSGTRMADIAAEADVAVQTVYFTFHTKAELLEACGARAVMGENEPLPPQEQPFWHAMIAAPTAAEAVRHFVEGNAAISARMARIDAVIASAVHEPDIAALQAKGEELRRAGYREAIEHIAERFGLREGLNVRTATDILLVLGDYPPYLSLVHEYGWSHDAFTKWQSGAVAELLLGLGSG
jgi:AcrR family transcriptional regulator